MQSRPLPLGRTVSRRCWQRAVSYFPKINWKEQASHSLVMLKRLKIEEHPAVSLTHNGLKIWKSLFLSPFHGTLVFLPERCLSCILGRNKLQNKSLGKHNKTCSAHRQCRVLPGSTTVQASYLWNIFSWGLFILYGILPESTDN